MPKVIDDVKNTILKEAKAQALTFGYSAVTMRSVAQKCNIAIGTIYNYFPSKDILFASFLLDAWLDTMQRAKQKINLTEDTAEKLNVIYDCLIEYSQKFTSIFTDKGATGVSYEVYSKRHKTLRYQIAEILRDIPQFSVDNNDFLPLFVAENLITWTVEGKSFEEIKNIIMRLI